jgi:hypothetical protein
MIAMRFLPKLGRCSGTDVDSGVAGETMDADVASEDEESHLLKTVGWVSAALGAVAIGLLVGRELRLRYKFNRRTPYDLYAHSGDELPDVDCGVGI